MSVTPLRWTGHALVDVGLAGLCALRARRQPEQLTIPDLDAASDFIAAHYFSGALDPYLSVVFTNNSGYCGPNAVDRPGEYAEVFRPHATPPRSYLASAAGERCAFCGGQAHAWAHRQHVPLFSADRIVNFRPDGQVAAPVCAACLLALQWLPMAARRAEGRLLAVLADEPNLTVEFARRFLEDNRRLMALALPADRSQVHAEFVREQPVWDKTRYKMAAVRGPRSLVLADLTKIAESAGPADLRPHPVAVAVYLLSNSGQGPSLDVFDMPSGAVSFVRRAAQAPTAAAWRAIGARFEPLKADGSDSARGGSRRRADATIAGRPGWSRNRAFEDLFDLFGGGFVDRSLAAAWLRRHVLGRIESDDRPSRDALLWDLTALFLEDVLTMRRTRIEAIKAFGDKLADWIRAKNDRGLYRALTFGDRPFEVRLAIVRAQRRGLPLGLDEYATVWLHDDDKHADERLVRDLVCIRVVEQLRAAGWSPEHPDNSLDNAAGEQEAIA